MSLSVDQSLRKAARLAKKGEIDIAAELYKAVLEKFPKNARALKALKELIPGVANASSAKNSRPHPTQLSQLVTMYKKGKLKQAVVEGEQLLEQFPLESALWDFLGTVYAGLSQLEKAVSYYQKALQIHPDFAEAHSNLGGVLRRLGRQAEAVISLQNSLRIRSENPRALHNLGNTLKNLGRLDEAIDRYNDALRLKPDVAEAHLSLSALKKYQTNDAHIQQMVDIVEQGHTSDSDRMVLSFALAKAYGDVEAYEAQFSALERGNHLRKEELQYDPLSTVTQFASIKSVFYNELPLANIPNEPIVEATKKPVFVLGMPRSGTTLVEQILSSHSKVYGGGELHVLGKALNIEVPAPGQLSAERLGMIREYYLAGLKALGVSEPLIVDKMPLNFRFIGFILLTMPEAKIIHVKRHARATCWSNFKNFFSSKGIGYAYNLNDVAEYFKMYTHLMQFWIEKFPERIFDIEYEALTEHQERETRRLLNYVGLEWENQCLQFYETDRAVRTVSSVQVRQEMYQGSSTDWMKYQEQLKPLIVSLEGY